MTTSPLAISVYKFNREAADLSTDQIEAQKARIAEFILGKRESVYGGFLADSFSQQLWYKGYMDAMGYRYTLDDDVRILVSRTDDCDNSWVEHVVPRADVKLINSYLEKMEDCECAWIFLKQEDIHVL